MSFEEQAVDCEQKLIKFLLHLLNIMPHDVAKHWTRFFHYFEVFFIL